MNGKPTVSEEWFDMVAKAHTPSHEPHLTEKGNVSEGYSFQFWLPLDYDQEFMALGAFGQYLWIDRERDFVVAQFSIGEAPGKPGANAMEIEVVMRALGTFVCGDTSLQGGDADKAVG